MEPILWISVLIETNPSHEMAMGDGENLFFHCKSTTIHLIINYSLCHWYQNHSGFLRTRKQDLNLTNVQRCREASKPPRILLEVESESSVCLVIGRYRCPIIRCILTQGSLVFLELSQVSYYIHYISSDFKLMDIVFFHTMGTLSEPQSFFKTWINFTYLLPSESPLYVDWLIFFQGTYT